MALRSKLFAGSPRLETAAASSPPLRRSERGDAVSRLQTALVAVGFPMPVSTCGGTRPADGIYGDETVMVVGKFQVREKLSADGIAGRDTLSRLDALLANSPIVPDLPVIVFPGDFAMTTARKSRMRA
jgi:peptidoglycan hydrolase-like protein with peptidoglycan-binding domain